MRNTLKKILFLFLLVVTALVCHAFSASALAETGQCGENVYWNYDSATKKLVISGEGEMYDYSLDSPFSDSPIVFVDIDNGVSTIGSYAFYECSYLENISIPDSVISIGTCAFNECGKLVEIELPQNITSIGGAHAFQGCESLVEFCIPSGVEVVEDHMFAGCISLEKIYIPSSVKTIYFDAFIYCKNLKEIEIDEGNENYCSDENGVVYSKDKTILKFYPTGKTNKEYVIPDGVKTIGGTAFCGVYSNTQNIWNGQYCNRSLQTVVIPRSVTEIKKCAFFYYTALKEIIFLGTEDEWNKISIGDLNFYKASPTFYYKNVVEQFPSGYNFYEDSYDFGNFSDKSLSKKYFTNLFSSANAEEIYKSQKKTGGLCCGFAYTTAAIYNNIPAVNDIYNKSLIGSQSYLNNLRDAKKSSKINIGDKTISVSDYIKYAYVYQLSEAVLQQRIATRSESVSDLYNLVKTVTSDNYLGVVIWLNGFAREGHENPGCHTVLCVGVDDDSILIDDSNLREDHGFDDELGHLNINDDGTWTYEPYNGKYNSDNTWISYAMDYHIPYAILLTGKKVVADEYWIDDNENSGNNYIVGCEKIDEGKGILYCDAENYELNDFEKTEFLDIGSGEYNSEYNGKFYWVDENEKISITNIENSGEHAEFHFSSGDTVSEVIISDGSFVTFDSDKSMEIDAEINNEYTVSYTYCFEDGNYKDNVVRISVSGVASDEVIEAKQTDNGIEVTGISDGTVTLTKDDEVIETKEIKDAVGDIEITYDKNGEDEEVELDYHSHSYSSAITTPATHLTEGVETFTCSCGDSYTKPVAKFEEHTYTSKVTTPATHLTEGVETFTCSCGDSYTKPVAKLEEHTYTSKVTTPATHLTEGVETFTCSCGDSYTKPVAKLEEHTYVASDVVAPSCEKGGYTVYTCECGHSYNGDKTSATGHSYVESVCSACGESKVDNCSCNCHKSGFMGFIWKIINLFNKLFKMNKTCGCGVSHY